MSSNRTSQDVVRREGIIFALVGPAGVGKTTLCLNLIAEFSTSLVLSVSATTREARPDEIDGISKHFLTRETFQNKIDNGEFFEWEEVHGNFYGTLQKTLRESVYSGKDLLLDIDVRGALKFKSQLPALTVICFVLPPNVAELKNRIQSRSPVSESELNTRLETAKAEYRIMQDLLLTKQSVDYLVINDVKHDTYQAVRAQLLAERTKALRILPEDVITVCRFS
jgi:guanylate kinase